jgi:hypothetical protein
MTEGFWEGHAKGAYIREYCLVRKGDGCARRLADAVILPDEPHGHSQPRGHSPRGNCSAVAPPLMRPRKIHRFETQRKLLT